MAEELYKATYSRDSLAVWDTNPYVADKMNELMKSSITSCLDSKEAPGFYGSSDHPSKNDYLNALVDFIYREEGWKTHVGNLFATYGATRGFTLSMSHFLQPGDFIFVEDLTYGRVVGHSQQYRLQIEGISCDTEGLMIEELEQRILECKKKSSHQFTSEQPYWGIIYLMTVLHNPKGTSYSEARCKQIIRLARQHELLIICDDVYNMFQYHDGVKVRRLVTYDDQTDTDYGKGHVISNCSWSKVLFPTIRLGWIETSPWIAEQFTSRSDIKASGGMNNYVQHIVAYVIKSQNFYSILNDIREYYKDQLEAACELLSKNFSPEIKFNKPMGSFFVWVELPEKMKASELQKRCAKRGVEFMLGPFYKATKTGHSYENCFRLCISNVEIVELKRLLTILCTEANIYVKEK